MCELVETIQPVQLHLTYAELETNSYDELAAYTYG